MPKRKARIIHEVAASNVVDPNYVFSSSINDEDDGYPHGLTILNNVLNDELDASDIKVHCVLLNDEADDKQNGTNSLQVILDKEDLIEYNHFPTIYSANLSTLYQKYRNKMHVLVVTSPHPDIDFVEAEKKILLMAWALESYPKNSQVLICLSGELKPNGEVALKNENNFSYNTVNEKELRDANLSINSIDEYMKLWRDNTKEDNIIEQQNEKQNNVDKHHRYFELNINDATYYNVNVSVANYAKWKAFDFNWNGNVSPRVAHWVACRRLDAALLRLSQCGRGYTYGKHGTDIMNCFLNKPAAQQIIEKLLNYQDLPQSYYKAVLPITKASIAYDNYCTVSLLTNKYSGKSLRAELETDGTVSRAAYYDDEHEKELLKDIKEIEELVNLIHDLTEKIVFPASLQKTKTNDWREKAKELDTEPPILIIKKENNEYSIVSDLLREDKWDKVYAYYDDLDIMPLISAALAGVPISDLI